MKDNIEKQVSADASLVDALAKKTRPKRNTAKKVEAPKLKVLVRTTHREDDGRITHYEIKVPVSPNDKDNSADATFSHFSSNRQQRRAVRRIVQIVTKRR